MWIFIMSCRSHKKTNLKFKQELRRFDYARHAIKLGERVLWNFSVNLSRSLINSVFFVIFIKSFSRHTCRHINKSAVNSLKLFRSSWTSPSPQSVTICTKFKEKRTAHLSPFRLAFQPTNCHRFIHKTLIKLSVMLAGRWFKTRSMSEGRRNNRVKSKLLHDEPQIQFKYFSI